MPADVEFTVVHRFERSSRVVWDEMVDWKRHEAWVPMTRIELHGEGPHDRVGETFTAYTGVWKLALEDRMRVSEIEWDEESSSGTCEVEKLGPILRGRAGFTIRPDGSGSVVEWVEDVSVRFVPGFAAPIARKVGAVGFAQGMKKLAKVLG